MGLYVTEALSRYRNCEPGRPQAKALKAKTRQRLQMLEKRAHIINTIQQKEKLFTVYF